MSKSETENNANIIPIESMRKKKHSLTSEITRTLFSDTWKNYLDEVYMAAVKINKKGIMTITPDPKAEKREGEGPVIYSFKTDKKK